MAVKDNQPTLPAELQAAFVEAPAPKLRSSRGATTFAKGHGRYEQRTVQALPAREDLSAAQSALWAGVLTLVMVTRVGGSRRRKARARRCGISSVVCRPTPAALAAPFGGTGVLRMGGTGC